MADLTIPTPPRTPTELPTPSSSSASLKASFSNKSTSIKENVQVMVRCRPKSKKELEEEPCWIIDTRQGTIELARITSTARSFQFDNVMMGEGNEQVYKAGIQDLVRSTMMGYNGTVFAYGQTASGKTYTMGTEKEPGVIPRAVEEVFSYIEEDTSGREYLLRVSYMEIYNERIKDLLSDENTNPEIVEDRKKGNYVRNLKEEIVKTSQDVINCIKKGEGNRHISATDYNERSSRSHTIFQLMIESRPKSIGSKTNIVRFSQLNLIDLAGSEKVTSDVERRKEGAYINKSLLTLGNVISKLTSDSPPMHIPFRDSKLTRILQTALSGNARIAVICTINPTFSSKDESMNTLKFAQRAKLIKTDAKMTKIGEHSELQKYLRTIAELQTRMQEKNDLETETKKRLENLLSLILTSSKGTNKDEERDNFQIASFVPKDCTIEEVARRCEEGFAAKCEAHTREMQRKREMIDQLESTVQVLESINSQKAEILAKREAQIELLNKKLHEKSTTSVQHLMAAFQKAGVEQPQVQRALETLFLSVHPEDINKSKDIITQSIIQQQQKQAQQQQQKKQKEQQKGHETEQKLEQQVEQQANVQADSQKKSQANTQTNIQTDTQAEQQADSQEETRTNSQAEQQTQSMTTPLAEQQANPLVTQEEHQAEQAIYTKPKVSPQLFISIQEACTYCPLPAFTIYQPIEEYSCPDLVEDGNASDTTEHGHSRENSFWEEQSYKTDSEVEEIDKVYSPYAEHIQQTLFYLPNWILVAWCIFYLLRL
ncbi:P-loop containing nucleoside triphosphate hydrolase protein [Rhizopus microsporus]